MLTVYDNDWGKKILCRLIMIQLTLKILQIVPGVETKIGIIIVIFPKKVAKLYASSSHHA